MENVVINPRKYRRGAGLTSASLIKQRRGVPSDGAILALGASAAAKMFDI